MRNYFLLMLVMLSVAEVIFTVFYIFLSQSLDAVPIVGSLLYLAAARGLYECYISDDYRSRKEKMIKDLLHGGDLA